MKCHRTAGLRSIIWLTLLSAGGLLRGQVMLSPVAIAGTDLTTFNDTVAMTNLINQSGVTTPFISGTTLFDTYFANPGQMFATSGDGGTNNWQSAVAFDMGPQGFIDFDLGGVYRVHQLAIWNRSLSNVTITVRSDLAGPAQDAGTFELINRQSFFFSYGAEVLPFAADLEGRYVRLTINGIYPIQGFNFGYSAAGEVVASVSPLAQPPTLSITRDPSGDVRVAFTGILTQATRIEDDFEPVPGSPASPYVVPVAQLSPRQFFRAQSE